MARSFLCCLEDSLYLGVSKNNGTPKWMVKIRENPIKMDELGENPPMFGNIHFRSMISIPSPKWGYSPYKWPKWLINVWRLLTTY